MPTTIIINKNFKEKYRVKGYVDWKEEKYISLIKNFYNFFSNSGRISKRSATNP